MELFPAIDLRGGRCVRLYQGDYARETVYGDDPVAQAGAFAAEGARWVHVVDLDAARTGRLAHRRHIAAVAAALGPLGVRLQVGGGVRSVDVAADLEATGVDRVVVGTAAMEQPDLVRALVDAGHVVAVGLDVRGREVAVRGWEAGSGRDVIDVVGDFEDAGVAAVVTTQIDRDGTLEGPDLEGLGLLLDATGLEVVASGGVGSLEHLRLLSDLEVGGRRLAGAIVGRALYEGRFTVAEALAASKAPA
jgi:phosphoribosylformimino-5-aminoimidazole carboxamide ribotide isomerase